MSEGYERNFLETVFDDIHEHESPGGGAGTCDNIKKDNKTDVSICSEGEKHSPAIRFDPFADNGVKSSSQNSSSITTTPKKNETGPSGPPPVKTDWEGINRDDGNFAIFSPAQGKARTVKVDTSKDNDINLNQHGMILGRVSVRSLLMRDWTPYFYVIMQNSEIRYYEDPNFLKNNYPEDYSILIYREKDDFERNPRGKAIKKVIPIRPNYCCGEVKRKEYSGEYGQLYYFVMQELSEIKDIPIAKFASNNRTDVDVMWMNIKCRIATARRTQVSNLAGGL